MRGDDVATRGPVKLVADESLRGVPVFTSAGKKLGALEGVAIVKPGDALTYVVLCRRRFMGLLKTRRLLRRNELTLDARRGGFTIIDEEASIGDEPDAPRRLDPARSP